MFSHIPPYPGDPILSLLDRYQNDTRTRKANLSVGLYYDHEGRIPVLNSVREAIHQLTQQHAPHAYLPMEGLLPYRQAAQRLIFGADSAAPQQQRIATIQSVGGSGALRVGAEFLRMAFPDSAIWLSYPTWENHHAIFRAAGFAIHNYPYYDPSTHGLAFASMLDTLSTLPALSIVLLQPCCHNPTGIDLSKTQWRAVIEVLQQRRLIPFVDMAYQGFGTGLHEDAWAVRAMVEAGLNVIVSHSFSKIFSLYGQRVGSLSIVCPDAEQAERVLGQLKATVRQIYSSPPRYGAELIAAVLNDAHLTRQWESEVSEMRQRMQQMRQQLKETLTHELKEAGIPEPLRAASANYLTEQRGMFSYTGLNAAEVDQLREQEGIYLVRSGRMCVAGLNDANIDYVAQAIASVVQRRVRLS